MKTAILVHELCKKYGQFEVLKGLNLQVYQGENLVILGRSGAGKSVLLRHIMALENADSGYILVGDICQANLSEEQQLYNPCDIGMLFQSSALFDSLTISQNVAFALKTPPAKRRFGKLSPSDVQSRVDHALSLVGLSGTQHQMPSDLSGGMKRRAALARLVVYRPKILLYDEPTAGLDPITSMQISELIAKMQEELQATSVIVTHDIPSALRIGNRLALHHNGQIAYIDEKERFISSGNELVRHFLSPSIQTLQQYLALRPSQEVTIL